VLSAVVSEVSSGFEVTALVTELSAEAEAVSEVSAVSCGLHAAAENITDAARQSAAIRMVLFIKASCLCVYEYFKTRSEKDFSKKGQSKGIPLPFKIRETHCLAGFPMRTACYIIKS
jgi:hypothetical protein